MSAVENWTATDLRCILSDKGVLTMSCVPAEQLWTDIVTVLSLTL